MNQPQSIKINLTLQEANQILDALGGLPFRDVYQLINKIQNQAEAQLQTPSTLPTSESFTDDVPQNNPQPEVISTNSSC